MLGGIVGLLYEGKINYCSNYGQVSSLNNEYEGRKRGGTSGGIVAECRKTNIEIDRVSNFGKVIGDANPGESKEIAGGIAGVITSGKKNMVTNAYNKGIVQSGGYNGEIIGYNNISEAISNCFYYKREESNLQGIGGSDNTEETYFSGTNGDSSYDYESLDEFLEKQNLK